MVDAKQTHQVRFGEHGLADAMQPGQVVILCPTPVFERYGQPKRRDLRDLWERPARDVFRQASAGGLADLDDATLLKWLEGDTA